VTLFDAKRELARFLDEHGVYGWVTGEMGQRMLLDDWIDSVLGQCEDFFDPDNADAAQRLAALRDMLDQPPDRKTITVKRIREILDS
jgi:hypothetical protein